MYCVELDLVSGYIINHLSKKEKKVLMEVYVWSKLKHKNIVELLGITTVFDHTISIVSPLDRKSVV